MKTAKMADSAGRGNLSGDRAGVSGGQRRPGKRAGKRPGGSHSAEAPNRNVFHHVSHDILMARVARRVADQRILSLIGRYLRAGVLVDGTVQPTPWSTPQGSPVSSLLTHILLDDLDKRSWNAGVIASFAT